MTLFEVNGVTPFGRHGTFPAAFALQSSETEEAFQWICQQLRTLAGTTNVDVIHDFHVVLSDDDRGQKGALLENFPETQQQLCLWHIHKNVKKHINEKWHGIEGDAAANANPEV